MLKFKIYFSVEKYIGSFVKKCPEYSRNALNAKNKGELDKGGAKYNHNFRNQVTQ